MRTTLTLDDDLAAALKKKAERAGRAFKDVLNEVLRAGLKAGLSAPEASRYQLRPSRLGGVASGVNLDKALDLAGSLEDEEIRRKLDLRK
jgi:plasmid stability protein